MSMKSPTNLRNGSTSITFVKKLNKNRLQSIRNWKSQIQNLPQKTKTPQIPISKNAQDELNIYKYKDEAKQLNKRSSLTQVSSLILNLINKSQQQELTNTQKYVLSGYIDVFIKEKYMMSDTKDNTTLTVQKLIQEWNKLSSSWELYKIKINRCQIGEMTDDKKDMIQLSFLNLNDQMLKIGKKNQKLQSIRKLMKKFYTQLIN